MPRPQGIQKERERKRESVCVRKKEGKTRKNKERERDRERKNWLRRARNRVVQHNERAMSISNSKTGRAWERGIKRKSSHVRLEGHGVIAYGEGKE